MKNISYIPSWKFNKENNKPAVKQSVLMLTIHGIAEGEWDGLEWTQYRWSCKVKDSDVLYWIHLEDLMRLEKESFFLQEEQLIKPELKEENIECIPVIKELISKFLEVGHAYNFGFGPKDFLQDQPEVDLKEEIDKMWNPRFNLGWDDNSLLSINHKSFEAIARHFAQWGAEHLKK